MLTQLAKRKLDAVIDEACEAQFKLEFSPSTTAELANSIMFLDEIQERVRRTFHVNSSFFNNHKCLCQNQQSKVIFTICSHQPILSSILSLLLTCFSYPTLFYCYTLFSLLIFLSLSQDYGAGRGAGDSMSDVQSD